MKDAVVRARIDRGLKEQAAAVLEANALEMSDAIRIFLQQVVLNGGLPFAVQSPAVRVVSGKRLWEIKREAQERDHALLESGNVSPESMMLLRPHRLQGARVEWPDDALVDD